MPCALLQVYRREAGPVEEFYQETGNLLNFEITGGIPETLPRLLGAIHPYTQELNRREEFAEAA